jgi:short-subunit dehydrogenase
MANRVVITGASSGIGRATALEMAAAGEELFLTARRIDRLESVSEECRKRGSKRVLIHPADLSKKGSGRALVLAALDQMDKIDILVCNAGYGYFGSISDFTSEQMDRMMRVNYLSAFESIEAALPHFKQNGSGHIVLVSSVIGKKAMPYATGYCATKFAQVGLGEALWGELKKEGIGVTVVCPGYTATEFHGVAATPAADPNRPIKGQDSEAVARAMVKAIRSNRKEIHLTWSGKLLLALDRISTTLGSHIMLAAGRLNHKPRSSTK